MTKRDWDEAFPETPDAVRQAVFRAFREGRRRDRQRRRLVQGLAIAATLVVMLGLGLLMRRASLNPHPDVLSPGASPQASGMPGGTGSPAATSGPEGTPESNAEEEPLVTAEPTDDRAPDVTAEPTQEPTEKNPENNASSSEMETAGADQELFYYLKPRQFSYYYYYYHATLDCATAFRDSQGLDGEVVSGTRADLEKSNLVPCPDCLFQPDKVYYSQGETCYHRDAHCAEMRYALPHLLTEALAAGLTACPACADGETVFLSGDYYHASTDCPTVAEAKKAPQVSEDGALCEGYLPCPECLGADYGTVSADEWRELLAQGIICAYEAADGTTYHLDPDCAGEGAAWLLCGRALRRGLTPCPECVPNGWQDGEVSYDEQAALPADVPIYFTLGGVYFHTNESCSGMRNAQTHTLVEALASGKEACPTCYPFDASSQESVTAYALRMFAQCFGVEYPFERNTALEETAGYGKSDVCTFLYGAAVDGGSNRLNSAQINLWQGGLDIEIVMEDPERMADFRSQWTNEALSQAYDRVYAQVQAAGTNTESALCSVYVTGVLDGTRWVVEPQDCTFVFLTTNPATGFRVFISVNYSIAGQHVLSMNWEYE